MAGNSRRLGATRKPGSKKARVVGSGGERSKSLIGKGPTPKAVDRTGHVAKRRAAAATKRGETEGNRPDVGRSQRSGRPAGRGDARERSRATDMVLGRNPVLEALEAGIPAVALLVQRGIDIDHRLSVILSAATELGVPTTEISRPDLDRRAAGVVHQGVLLQTAAFKYSEFDEMLGRALRTTSTVVALDGITDPRNLGAIIRSAAAFGAAGVVIPERRSAAVTPTVWRASAGTLARVPVAMITNMSRSIVAAQKLGFTAIGLDAGGDTELSELELAEAPALLVVGGEGKGLGRLVGQTCDLRIRIDMVGPAESLNAAVAAGIALRAIAIR